MTTGATIAILVALAVVFLGVVVAVRLVGRGPHSGGRGLRRRFGPEYDAAVARHDGDEKAAAKDLKERLRRHEDVRIAPLTAQSRELYVARWTGLQEQFVDAPARAVAEAELMLGRLARERGFPADTWDELQDSLTVHHPHTAHGFREIHLAAARARAEQVPTEQLREALVRARGLFEDLVREHPQDHRPHRHARHGGPRPAEPTTRGTGGAIPQHAREGGRAARKEGP
ncbi:hypothetical protein [Streptomyces cinnamoneus]|uniref:Secreted protein n=1 Tax=Streptomyces cinnamoneus TaxID=53446 RepID=A0A918T9B8_STRCJ|nr:hypothetical protein [Streptomyces cinnamoneus]GHC35039.1 hypothetical protein GCM10010507_05020 [Streptomyces cinnamoneus]